MKYDLNCNVACESSGKTGSAVARKPASPMPGLAGVLITVAIGAYHGADVAHAQGSQDRQAIRQACAADYRSLCSGVQPGGGRILACLQQNAAKLSPSCQKALADAKKSQ